MIVTVINTDTNVNINAISGTSLFRAGTVVINTIIATDISIVPGGSTLACSWIHMR